MQILTEIATVLDQLLRETGASRVTLRQDLPGDYAFPVTHEALAAGAGSLKDERTIDLRTQPVVKEIGEGRQVVQDDCRAAFDDPVFHAMLATYGGLAAQIVTPIVPRGHLAAILSVHQLGAPRGWTAAEIAACGQAAGDLARLL